MSGVRTCVESLMRPGRCCMGCLEDASLAALEFDDDGIATEHAICANHPDGMWDATKPLQWAEAWGPS